MAWSPSTSKSGSAAVEVRKSVENVEKCFVGTSSQMTYNHKLVMLMVWMFDCQEKHLEKSSVMRMKKASKLNKAQAKAAMAKKKGKENG